MRQVVRLSAADKVSPDVDEVPAELASLPQASNDLRTIPPRAERPLLTELYHFLAVMSIFLAMYTPIPEDRLKAARPTAALRVTIIIVPDPPAGPREATHPNAG